MLRLASEDRAFRRLRVFQGVMLQQLCVGCVQRTGPSKMTGAKNGMKSNMSVTLKSEPVHVEEGFLDLGKLESVVS